MGRFYKLVAMGDLLYSYNLEKLAIFHETATV
jgi:hypothetical protein